MSHQSVLVTDLGKNKLIQLVFLNIKTIFCVILISKYYPYNNTIRGENETISHVYLIINSINTYY